MNIEERARHRSSTLETIGATKQKAVGSEEDAAQADSVEVSTVVAHGSSQEDAEMEGLAGAMSALKFVPPSVRFGRGRGKGRGGFSRT